MKIVSFSQPVLLQSAPQDGHTSPHVSAINPGERMVINDDTAAQILGMQDNKLESISDFLPFYEMFNKRPAKFRGTRILFYRNRGIGDQLCAGSLSRFFTEKLKAQCFQLSDKHHEDLWIGNPYITGLPIRFPLGIDSLVRFRGRPFFDYFFPMESVCEWDTEPEQGNYYDRLFSRVGLDPKEVESRFKVPTWGMIDNDIKRLEEWKRKFAIKGDYVTLQLRATNSSRTPPIKVLDMILERLNDLGIPVLCMDDKLLSEELIEVGKKYINARNVACTVEDVRLYGTIICNSKLVIGPDSSAIHFAAVQGVPCIGLWGPFSPESRVKYYENHYPLYHPEMCPNSPCFNYLPTLPAHKCPEGSQQSHCAVFDGMTSEEVDNVVSRVVENHKI